jgi:ribonuclease Y
VVIDEATPDVVVYSGGDGVQREIARRTLEKTLREPASAADAAAVTRLVEKVKRDLDRTMIGAAREVANTLGIKNIHAAIMEQLGRLLYRTSYGQNVLYHSREVAFIGGLLSTEMHLDFAMSRRSCLLHDVGKAVSVEVEGGHPEIGAELATKHGEHPLVVNAIAAHHEGVERHSLYPLLVQVADAISGARPGARRDSTEKYLLRLEQIMAIVNSKPGIEAAYPMQAGREIRVHVDPERVEERDVREIAKKIAREIEENVTYPGKIRVTLVRESRTSAVAK